MSEYKNVSNADNMRFIKNYPMKNIFLLLMCCCFSFAVFAQKKKASPDKTAIQRLLNNQKKSWNEGNLEGYMDGYWKNDSLTFIGKRGVTKGWKETLENYKKSYPDKTAMGKLEFQLLSIKVLGKDIAYVIGKWELKRTAGDLSGHFTLLLRKINNKWVIVSDHSS